MKQEGYEYDYAYDWGNKVPASVPSGLNIKQLFGLS
jgi:hypothetical protein